MAMAGEPTLPSGGPAALRRVETWIFDLDNTLYPASCNLFEQVDRRIGEFVVAALGVDAAEARRVQKRYFHEYGTTLRGLMERHRVAPGPFLEYVHAIDVSPVQPSPALDAALARLPGRKVVFTNGSAAHADKVLTRLGVARRFDDVFDIAAADYLPKPEPAAYARLVERLAIRPRSAAMIDDLPRNLVPAAALGMVTVLVRTGAPWAEGGEGDHIHHATDDLVAWLEQAGR